MKSVLLFLVLLTGQAFGVSYAPPVVVTATGTSTKVMNFNAKRGYIIIINRGSNTAVAKFGTTAQSGTEGVPIPAGGSYEPIQAPTNPLWLVTTASTSAVTIVEGNN